jgi:LysM repeat protein
MGKRVYRVKKGDDFFKISRKLYGNASYAMDLMRANPGFNRVGPGMVLRLPKMDPRLTRKRKIKRRMKDYVPPEEPEDTTNQGIPSEGEEGLSEGEVSETENIGLSAAASALSGASLGGLDDPAFEDEIINSIAETAQKMGLIGSKMGKVSTASGKASSTTKPQFKTKEGGVVSSGLTTYSEAQTQAGESSQTATGSTAPPVTLTEEQIDTLKANLEKLGLDVDVAMAELGLGEGAAASTTASQTTDTGVDDGDDGKDGPGGKVARPAEPDEPTPTLTEDGAYIVQEGDTLTDIASMFGLSLDAIIQANTQIENPDQLQIGEKVYIPLNPPATPSPTPIPIPTPTPTEPSPPPPAPTQTQGDGVPQIPPEVYTRRDLQIWFGRQMANPNLDERDKDRLERLYLSSRNELPVAHPNEFTLLFSGGDGRDIDNPGLAANKQTFAWLLDVNGASIPEEQWVQYPGVERDEDDNPIPPYGKHHQVLMGLEKDPGDKDLNLIGYSAGADSCLMYAYEQVQKGKKVKTMILLDPSMTGVTIDGRKLEYIYNGDKKPLKDPLWKIMLDEIIKRGTDVIIVDDPEAYEIDPDGKLDGPAENYQAPVGESEDGVKYGNYHYEPRSPDRPHWDKEGEKHGIGTNNDLVFRADMNKYFWDWRAEKLNW